MIEFAKLIENATDELDKAVVPEQPEPIPNAENDVSLKKAAIYAILALAIATRGG